MINYYPFSKHMQFAINKTMCIQSHTGLKVNFLEITLASLAITCSALAGDLPDPRVTPGSTNPQVTQENIQQTICVPGFTKSVRPHADYTNRIKRIQLDGDYSAADKRPHYYEEDHLIPLSLGGNPTDVRNLWVQSRKSEWSAEKKDQLEFLLHRLVCRGEVSLQNAQSEIATDWIAAYKKYVPPNDEFKVKGGWD